MKFTFSIFRRLVVITFAALAVSAFAAETFPSRTVTIIVPFSAGGGTDAVARVMAKSLQAEWGQPVVVENRAGAEGWVGTQRLLSQPADGHTILLQLNTMLLWKWALPSAKIDFGKDLTLISKVQNSPMVVLVRGDMPVGSLRELFEHCRKATKPCSFGTATVSAEMVGRQLADLGVIPNAVKAAYKGTSAIVNDLLGGHVDVALVSAALATPLTLDGRAKSLAVGSPARYPRLPNVPTFSEAGYAARGGNTWYGLMVRQGTPANVVQAISAAVQKAGKSPDVISAIELQGGVPVFSSPEEFTREFAVDRAAIAPLGDKYLK